MDADMLVKIRAVGRGYLAIKKNVERRMQDGLPMIGPAVTEVAELLVDVATFCELGSLDMLDAIRQAGEIFPGGLPGKRTVAVPQRSEPADPVRVEPVTHAERVERVLLSTCGNPGPIGAKACLGSCRLHPERGGERRGIGHGDRAVDQALELEQAELQKLPVGRPRGGFLWIPTCSCPSDLVSTFSDVVDGFFCGRCGDCWRAVCREQSP